MKMAGGKTPVTIMLVIIFIFTQRVRHNPRRWLLHSKAIDWGGWRIYSQDINPKVILNFVVIKYFGAE